MMARRSLRANPKKVDVRSEEDDQLIKQADVPAAQAGFRDYEVVSLPEDPNGDVIVRGEVKMAKAVRVHLPWREMVARGVFGKAALNGKPVPQIQIEAALAWYQERLDMAESYSVKSGLDFSDRGGGGPSSHIPVQQAAIFAQDDVRWVRSLISTACLPVFDSVMRDGVSFIETARRISGGRHLSGTAIGRAFINRTRARVSRLFIQAACELAREHHIRTVPQEGKMVGQPAPFIRWRPEAEEQQA